MIKTFMKYTKMTTNKTITFKKGGTLQQEHLFNNPTDSKTNKKLFLVAKVWKKQSSCHTAKLQQSVSIMLASRVDCTTKAGLNSELLINIFFRQLNVL